MCHALGCKEAAEIFLCAQDGLEVVKGASGPEKMLHYTDEGKKLFLVDCLHGDFHGPMCKSQMGELAPQKMLARTCSMHSDVLISRHFGIYILGLPAK